MHSLAESIPPDVVVIFRKDVSNAQINTFLESAISTPDPRGGFAHRPGVGGIRITRVGPYDGYVVAWTKSATAAQRTDVRWRIDSDPIVCQVFEHVEPSSLNPSSIQCRS